MPVPESALLAFDQSPLAVWLRTSLAYPVAETIHLIGLATLFGSLLLVDLRLLGAFRSLPLDALARSALPCTWLGFTLVAGSGSLLFAARMSELLTHPVFRLKMLLLLVAGLNAALLHSRGPLSDDDRVTRAQAVASLLIWLAIITCGRWIAYV